MTSSDTLQILASGRPAAKLFRGEGGALSLRYEDAWAATDGAYPLSLSLPLSAQQHRGEAVLRWVEGLSPFGALRRQVEDATGASQCFDLLARLGGDAPGALRIAQPGEKQAGLWPVADPEAFLALWESSPLLLGTEGVSHTIAEESSDRLPVSVIEDAGALRLAIALHGAPSTHMLWREPDTGFGALENRVFHLALAGAVGLPVCGFRVMQAGRNRLLLTMRDDRERRDNGWVRLHRESLAQAMGARIEDRFGREPGVFSDLESIFIWADGALGARERLRLLDAFLFNALIGAPDAHLLRYAIRMQPAPALAPLMELAGPGLTPPKERRFAQRIGGAARWPERITADQWRAFAAAAKLNSTFTLDRLLELAQAIEQSAPLVVETLERTEGLQPAILGRLAREVIERAGDAARRLAR